MTLFGYGLSLAVFSQLPHTMPLGLEALLPWTPGGQPELVPRAVAALLLPTVALLLAVLLHEAPVSPLGRTFGRLTGFGVEGGKPAVEYHKFAPSYRLIVCWVVGLVLSMHLAVLANALGWHREPGTIVGLAFGIGLIIVGNIMPRLRPNPVAGIRTQRIMSDPTLWARVHRLYGASWVVAGVVVCIVALAAPRYALVAGIAALLLSTIVIAIPRVAQVAAIITLLGVAAGSSSQAFAAHPDSGAVSTADAEDAEGR
jgi:uncharacterized membrane protein